MKVYNETKTEILTDYDLKLGHLIKDKIVVPEVCYIKEEGHYETIREYENGGKDVKWVIDTPGVEHKPAREEEILIYVPYTEKELKIIDAEKKIQELKDKLEKTDYQAIKYAEGQMTPEDYEPMKIKRQQWRVEINELENIALEQTKA